jgi:cadmium resistance protein CadD (predicted permease)
MKSKNLSELSTTELIAKEKTLKILLGAFGGILSVLALMLILLFIQKQYTIALPLLAVLFSLSTVWFTNKKELSDIKTELENRNNNNTYI